MKRRKTDYFARYHEQSDAALEIREREKEGAQSAENGKKRVGYKVARKALKPQPVKNANRLVAYAQSEPEQQRIQKGGDKLGEGEFHQLRSLLKKPLSRRVPVY